MSIRLFYNGFLYAWRQAVAHADGHLLLWNLGLFGILLLGCTEDRHAGTEVGNPEVTVVARIGITPDTLGSKFERFSLKVMGVDYVTQGQVKGSIWTRDTGYLIDMVSPSQQAHETLPALKMEDDPWQKAEVRIWSSSGSSNLDSNLNFSEVNDPQWMKWSQTIGDSSFHGLFYLAPEMHLRMEFGVKTMEGWHQQDSVLVTTRFNVSKWLENCALVNLMARRGRNGISYYVVSPNENPSAFQSLSAVWMNCFQADSVRQDIP